MRLKIPFDLILILLLSKTTFAEFKVDRGLEKACEQMGGIFTKRDNKDAVVGDKCLMEFKVATRNDEDAREFCELYAPWRLLKAETGENNGRSVTKCHVEATFTCISGWIQMFGKCFMMPNKQQVATYPEAEKICKDENAQIASMHHRYIVGIWKRYFRKIGQIWVQATETWDKYIQDAGASNGSALALAFTGRHYDFSVPHNSLIRINPNIRLQVLCEYQPPMTPAEINYLGRRYSEIYYPLVPVEHGVLVRSASSYTRSSNGLDVCKKALKPFMIDAVGPFIPDKQTLKYLTEHPHQLLSLTRSGAEAPVDKSSLKSSACEIVISNFRVNIPNSKLGYYALEDFDEPIECDNMLSAGITHFQGKDAQLKVMSDSRSVPIWCKLGYSIKLTYKPFKDYQVFERDNGEFIGHKLYVDKKDWKDFEGADRHCKREGAVLAGINSKEEGEFLLNMIKKVDGPKTRYVMGGRRRETCTGPSGWFNEYSNICSQANVFYWLNNIAQDFKEELWKKYHPKASSAIFYLRCLALVHIEDNHFLGKDGYFVDYECEREYPFFCSKKLELTTSLVV